MLQSDAEVLQRIKTWYGAAIPSSLERLALWYGGDPERLRSFEKRFGWNLIIPEALFHGQVPWSRLRLPTYLTDPVELQPVLGCYTRYGYLDLAPELGLAEDLTMVVSDPNSYDFRSTASVPRLPIPYRI